METISRPWIRIESKTSADKKAYHTREYMSLFKETCNAAIKPWMRFFKWLLTKFDNNYKQWI